MTIHELKTIQPYFSQVFFGWKRFEVRKNDRNFKVGDFLLLKEYDPKKECFSGKEVLAEITYILDDEKYCKKGYVIIGFQVTKSIYG